MGGIKVPPICRVQQTPSHQPLLQDVVRVVTEPGHILGDFTTQKSGKKWLGDAVNVTTEAALFVLGGGVGISVTKYAAKYAAKKLLPKLASVAFTAAGLSATSTQPACHPVEPEPVMAPVYQCQPIEMSLAQKNPIEYVRQKWQAFMRTTNKYGLYVTERTHVTQLLGEVNACLSQVTDKNTQQRIRILFSMLYLQRNNYFLYKRLLDTKVLFPTQDSKNLLTEFEPNAIYRDWEREALSEFNRVIAKDWGLPFNSRSLFVDTQDPRESKVLAGYLQENAINEKQRNPDSFRNQLFFADLSDFKGPYRPWFTIWVSSHSCPDSPIVYQTDITHYGSFQEWFGDNCREIGFLFTQDNQGQPGSYFLLRKIISNTRQLNSDSPPDFVQGFGPFPIDLPD